MKKVLLSLMVAVSALSMVVPEADARRLGGGGSIGKQSSGVTRQMQSPQAPARPAEAARPAQPAATPATPARPSPWRGILGGALLGLGLGALLSHLGIGGALASIIGTILTFALIALAIMFIVRLVRGKKAGTNGMQPAYANVSQRSGYTPEIGSRVGERRAEGAQPAAFAGASSAAAAAATQQGHAPWGVPADFDVPGFLRHAKTHYIRLQAAWDRADLDDIREFTTPEVFAELKMQIQERGNTANHTDVMLLDAELMGIETVGDDYLASVRFSGMIKEEQNAPATPVNEVWNLTKPVSGQGGWMLAGIQQYTPQQ